MKRILIVVCMFFAAMVSAETVVDITTLGAGCDGRDSTPAVQKALAVAATASDSVVIKFPKGRYDFAPHFAGEDYLFISNNDEGLKRVIFNLRGLKNITIDGCGSEFIFHGLVIPFCVKSSANIKFKDFTVDFFRPHHSEAKVVSSKPGETVLEINNAEYPFDVRNGVLMFFGKPDPLFPDDQRKVMYPYKRINEFDAAKKELAYRTPDRNVFPAIPAKKLSENRVAVMHPTLLPKVGNVLVFQPQRRDCPDFVITDAAGVLLENLIVHSANSMGVLGENSADITVRNCKFTPRKDRYLSCGCDATHFVNCTGKIVLENNLFENQLDDATNIHGIYEQIVSIDGNTVITRLVHVHQYGFETFSVGQRVEFVDGQSIVKLGEGEIESVERINKEYKRLTFKNDVPKSVEAKDAVAVIRKYPEVLISNNIIRNNRARGILLNSRGKTVVRKNYFHASGTAILFEGDAAFWFEQGGVSDCLITENVFDNCGYSVWNNGIIAVDSGIRADRAKSRYHKNIRIENNTFNVFDEFPLLNVFCVDGLLWRNNKVNKTTAYPARKLKNPQPFKVSDCDNVKIIP